MVSCTVACALSGASRLQTQSPATRDENGDDAMHSWVAQHVFVIDATVVDGIRLQQGYRTSGIFIILFESWLLLGAPVPRNSKKESYVPPLQSMCTFTIYRSTVLECGISPSAACTVKFPASDCKSLLIVPSTKQIVHDHSPESTVEILHEPLLLYCRRPLDSLSTPHHVCDLRD